MELLQAILIFAGLSLDSFIVMMQKGAQLRELRMRRLTAFAGEFAAIAGIMFMIGFRASRIFTDIIIRAEIEITIAALIVFFVGVFQLTKSFLHKNFEEKLDNDFGYKRLMQQALYTSIDVFFVGAAYGFYGVHVAAALMIAFITSFIAVFVALLVGYNLGARYQRTVGMVGGALIIFFSIYMIATYVLVR